MAKSGKLTMSEMLKEMRKNGQPIPRSWSDRERDIHVADSGTVFEHYVPPEGDGRKSIFSVEGLKETGVSIYEKGKNVLTRERSKLEKKDKEFKMETFPDQALKIYKDVHECMMKGEKEELHKLVTDFCFPTVWNEIQLRSIKWEFVENVEPPRVVLIRSQSLVNQDNIYSQVTVKIHSLQKLAVYDQWGRLILGDPDVAKEVVEYVIFEKHLPDRYGSWRLHFKLRPKWEKKAFRYPLISTFAKPTIPEQKLIDNPQASKGVWLKEKPEMERQ